MDNIDRINLRISFLLRASIVIACGFFAYYQDWFLLFESIAILFITFLPSILQRNYKIYMPISLEVAAVVFIYATLFLGETANFYYKIAWWDDVLHWSSGIMLGLLGFFIVYVLHQEGKIKMDPKFVALFAFVFAVAIGAVWEIFEFGMDTFFGFNMQKSGLVDTMGDLMLDAAGALIVSFLSYFYLTKGKGRLFTRWMKKFAERNPGLGKK